MNLLYKNDSRDPTPSNPRLYFVGTPRKPKLMRLTYDNSPEMFKMMIWGLHIPFAKSPNKEKKPSAIHGTKLWICSLVIGLSFFKSKLRSIKDLQIVSAQSDWGSFQDPISGSYFKSIIVATLNYPDLGGYD